MSARIVSITFAALLSLSTLAGALPQVLVPAADTTAKAGAIPVIFNAAVLQKLAPGDPAELVLPNGARHVYVHDRTVDHGAGMVTWIAASATTGERHRAVVTTGPGGSFGWMQTEHGKYQVFAQGGRQWLVSIAPPDISRFLHDSPLAPKDIDGPKSLRKGIPTFIDKALATSHLNLAKAAPTPAVQVDMMILYTRDVAEKHGVGLLTLLQNLVATVNQVLTDSEVAITLRLVNATMVEHSNTISNSETLYAMTGASDSAHRATFENVTWGPNAMRDAVGADLVAMVRSSDIHGGGMAYVTINRTPGVIVGSSAFSVSSDCSLGFDCGFLFAHEVGHTLGNFHDRAVDAFASNGQPSRTGYNFGHHSCANGLACDPFVPNGCAGVMLACKGTDAGDFSTIMSGLASVVMRYSNPQRQCIPQGGSAPGRPCGIAEQADNARSINEMRQNISAYRNQTLTTLPGSVQFTSLSQSAPETGGLTFTASRLGGSSGAISVNYAVTGRTAVAGLDFVRASGTLNWADGDNANKSFTVTLVNDQLAEGAETLTATLSNPSGAKGVYLGYPVTASGMITEPWPPGGTMPSGWTTPSGSPYPWAVANDFSFDGDGVSLKSGQLDFTQETCTFAGSPAICPSAIQYQGTFVAGPISFAYKIDTVGRLAFLEFLVDNQVVMSRSGEVASDVFETNLTAGTHTLQWRFRQSFASGCQNSRADCTNRAWIDNVSFPIPASTVALASSANPANPGQAVTFTATVSGGSGSPTGAVQFRDGDDPIAGCTSVAISGGIATCTTSSLTNGFHSITAVYVGNLSLASGTSSAISLAVGVVVPTIAPGTLAFGGQSMNTTSPTQAATVTNAGTTPVTFGSATASAGFTVAGSTCATVAGGGTCQVSVAFRPNAPGNLSGTLSLPYASGAGTVTLSLTGTGERSLVTHYYRSILRRAPDSGGKAFWEAEAARVAALGVNVNETWFAMAQSFYGSGEYTAFNRNPTEYVRDLYSTFFNRDADAAGLSFWTGLLAQGLPREVALVGFMFSPEFTSFAQAIFGTTTTRAEVDTVVDFYRGLLARLPDSGGFNFWLGRFRTAQCSGSAAINAEVEAISSAYAESGEYAARGRTNAQYVGDLYNAFLRRGGDLDGVKFWISTLELGFPRSFVRQQFITSSEFSARVAAIVAQGCLK